MDKVKGQVPNRAAGADIPRELAEVINNAFVSSMGRILSVNDNYGSLVMREAVLNEVNGLRRFVLVIMEKVASNSRSFTAKAVNPQHTESAER